MMYPNLHSKSFIYQKGFYNPIRQKEKSELEEEGNLK